MHSYAQAKDPLGYCSFASFSSGSLIAEASSSDGGASDTSVSDYLDLRSTQSQFGTLTDTANTWAWGVADHYEGAVHYVNVKASVGPTQTVTITANLEDATSTTDAGLADLTTNWAITLGSTASTAAQVIAGRLAYSADLTTANRYIRSRVSASFSSDSTTVTNQVDYAVPGIAFFGGNYSTGYSTDGTGYARLSS